MPNSALSNTIGWLGAFLVAFAVNLWSVTQGGAGLSSLPFVDGRGPVTASYFGIVIIGFTLAAICGLAIVHARQAEPFEPILPVFGVPKDASVDPAAWTTITFQVFAFLIIFALPAASLVHLNKKVGSGDGWIWNEALPARAAVPAGCQVWWWGRCGDQYSSALLNDIATAVEIEEVAGQRRASDTPARLWLADHWCDLVWHMELSAPQTEERKKKGGAEISAKESRAEADLGLIDPQRAARVRALMASNKSAGMAECAGPPDRSDRCKADQSKCRGVQWVRIGSPLLVMVPTLSGLGSFLLLSFVLVSRWRARRAAGGPKPDSAELDHDKTG